MPNINLNNRDPIYLQVIDYFRKMIVSGQLETGEELPSRRQIAQKLGINPNTVQRAFSEMEENEWIYTEPNRPSRVTQNLEVVKQIKQEFVQEAIEEFVISIQTIDITFEEVTDLLLQELQKQDTNKELESKNQETPSSDNGGD